MNLLGTEIYRNELAECLSMVTDELVVLSAFVTRPGFQWILNKTNAVRYTGTLVVRWHLDELLSGASSLKVYSDAKEAGWKVFICSDLHAKSMLIDKAIVFVGSANLTGYGLSIVPGANRELGVKFKASSRDIAVFEAIVSESTLATNSIVEKLKLFLATVPKQDYGLSSGNWPDEILVLLEKPPQKLWVAEMLWASPENLLEELDSCSDFSTDAAHNLRVLGLENSSSIDIDSLKKAFLTSRSWKWLYSQLSGSESKELYFGNLSSLLHNALLDDPAPYRMDVKGLMQNLYLWVEYLGSEYIGIDVPYHKSQRMFISG